VARRTAFMKEPTAEEFKKLPEENAPDLFD
jgi:hypothetical protein